MLSAPETVVSLYTRRIAADPNRPALIFRRRGKMTTHTWGQIAAAVTQTVDLLAGMGAQIGDRVAMISPNRYEWIIADLAIQLARCAHVPIHNTLSGPQIVYQILDSGARIVFVAGEEQVAKLAPSASELPSDLTLISFDSWGNSAGALNVRKFSEALRGRSGEHGARLVATAEAEVSPEDLATIIYTSGTTGEPKGVMLTQGNLASNAVGAVAVFDVGQTDTRLNWLPLSHIFARTCDLYTWIAGNSELALADGPETVAADLKEWRPTLINGVPYFFEKLTRHLRESGRDREPGALREAMGGRMRACCSGGAPLPDHVAEFFRDQDVFLAQGYGLTETSPVISAGTRERCKLGTVGPPIPGVEVKIAADGEILTRGPHVMRGYWNKPEATALVLVDGWFHTGDLGQIDEDGHLKITGRKKELIVTAGGKNIAPNYLEGLLNADPLIHQTLVVGDRRNYLAALIVPNPEPLKAEILARRIPVFSPAQALVHADVLALYEERIRERLACVSRYEQVCKFRLLDRAFSVEQGELTLTLKLRRKEIHAHFADEIESMYAKEERAS